jgi:hypothetical protein
MDAVATGDHNARPVLEASVWHIRSSQYLSVTSPDLIGLIAYLYH